MINMFIDYALRFAILIWNGIGNDFDGTVRAVQLANATTVTMMEVVFVVFQDDFAFEPVEHSQLFTVFRILLSYNLFRMYKVVSRNHEPFPEGF